MIEDTTRYFSVIPKQWSKLLWKRRLWRRTLSWTLSDGDEGGEEEMKLTKSSRVVTVQVPTRCGQPRPHHLHWALPGCGRSRIRRHHQPHHPRLQVRWSSAKFVFKRTHKNNPLTCACRCEDVLSVWSNGCQFVTSPVILAVCDANVVSVALERFTKCSTN